jgi:hypothetical protein
MVGRDQALRRAFAISVYPTVDVRKPPNVFPHPSKPNRLNTGPSTPRVFMPIHSASNCGRKTARIQILNTVASRLMQQEDSVPI